MKDKTDNLVHCIYSSASTIEFTHDDILALLEKARNNNANIGVTGMLLYDSGSFFQVLEGDQDQVNALLEIIQRDDRHDRVVKIIFEEIDERSFSEWTMGYSKIARNDLKNIEGMNDFFHSGNIYTDLDESRAKMLLKAFKDGKWRTSIN